jgi:hypothetical protein
VLLEVQHPKRLWTLFFKYAATILLPVVLGISVYWYMNNRLSETVHPIVEIQPGSRNAVLVMANGKSVDLVNDLAKNLIENDGTVIKNTNDELSYDEKTAKKSKETLLNTLIVPKGGEYSLVLSDGTRIFVNSMSKLVFPVRFSGNKREISLEGEAYFEVARDESKPFIVTVKGVQVEVLGTSFNIKAYPDDNQSFTTLVEGKVKLSPDNINSKSYFLEANQQAVFDPLSSGIVVQEVDASQIALWVTGKYSFTNQSLEEIMKTLSRWYDFNYQYENESLKSLKFEGGLNKYESIDPILDIIVKTGKVNVLVKGNDVLFTTKK